MPPFARSARLTHIGVPTSMLAIIPDEEARAALDAGVILP